MISHILTILLVLQEYDLVRKELLRKAARLKKETTITGVFRDCNFLCWQAKRWAIAAMCKLIKQNHQESDLPQYLIG